MRHTRSTIALFIVFSSAAGCIADDTSTQREAQSVTTTCSAWAGTHSGVDFTAEQATNAVDMADHATAEELQALRGVGPSIAARVIDARPFADQPDPLAALDAVPWVGAEVLASFRDHSFDTWCALDDGRQSCCFAPVCEGGAPSGVAFTPDQAFAILGWANTASHDQLISVCGVGTTVANNIANARPIRTLDELDAVPYVGATLLHRMLGDAGYECAITENGGWPVEYDWCVDNECQCAATPDPTGDPVTEEYVCEGDLMCLYDRSAELGAVVDDLLANGPKCEESVWFPVRYGYVDITTVDGAATEYVVNLVQTIDPEGGIQCWIEYVYDGDLGLTDGPNFMI